MTVEKMASVLSEDQVNYQFLRQVEPDWTKLFACVQCGTCSASCPAAERMDYTPRQLWGLLRLGLRDQVINSRTFWLCTQCDACTARCPRGILTSETMRHLREWAVTHGLTVPSALLQLRDAVNATHNILNEDNQTRTIWAQNLQVKPASFDTVKPGTIEVLLYTGCVSALYPMAYSIPQSLVQILEQAKITYATMGGDEWCCGYPLYGAGMKDQLPELAQHNIKRAQALAPQVLVTSCSSCYHTWRHLYCEHDDARGDLGFQVLHASEFLARIIAEGRIKMTQTPGVVTYHDPCDLGRKSGVYDAPRAIIQSISGLSLREMPNHRENALCCGGGGDVAMIEEDVTQHIAERRLAQAVATGAEAVISSCQQCKRTLLQSARKTKTRIRVLDVTELVWQAMEK